MNRHNVIRYVNYRWHQDRVSVQHPIHDELSTQAFAIYLTLNVEEVNNIFTEWFTKQYKCDGCDLCKRLGIQ